MSNAPIQMPQAEPGRRRHCTPEQKRTMLEASRRPGNAVSSVARQGGVTPSLTFR